MCAHEDFLSWDKLQKISNELEKAIDLNDHRKLRSILIKAIPEFKPQSEIRDILYIDS